MSEWDWNITKDSVQIHSFTKLQRWGKILWFYHLRLFRSHIFRHCLLIFEPIYFIWLNRKIGSYRIWWKPFTQFASMLILNALVSTLIWWEKSKHMTHWFLYTFDQYYSWFFSENYVYFLNFGELMRYM